MVFKRSNVILLLLILFMIFILFSTKVTAENPETTLLYEGLDYDFKITYDSAAGISENAVLKVIEFHEGSKEFQQLYSKTNKYMTQKGYETISKACFYDVCIIDNGVEIEPDTEVKVTITYKDGVIKEQDDHIKIIHFVEDGSKELLDVKEEKKKENLVTKISFEQESFSVIGMITFDGVDSDVKSGKSEIIYGADMITVKKKWSDGNELHGNDKVEISLFEMLSSGEWGFCNKLVLTEDNAWSGIFKNLDKEKSYSIKETKVLTEDLDKTAIYRSEISNYIVKKWCITSENQLKDGQDVVLLFGDSVKYVFRKSSAYEQLNLRLTKVSLKVDAVLGTYCAATLENYHIWKVMWDEESNSWELYNVHGESYLTLSYDEENDRYLWTTSREKTEGSRLQYVNGTISATVGNVTKYLGNISGDGPYEGVDPNSKDITEFQVLNYEIAEPAVCNITNTKNESVQEETVHAGITTTKTIDYLGDGNNNTDTEIDDVPAKILKDIYRLKLEMGMQTDQTGLDLLMVIDVSSSMRGVSDAKDENGNAIPRSEALRQALNQFVPDFLGGNDKNRISIVAFEADSIILQEWTKSSQEILEKINYQVDGELPLYAGDGTNYESALIRAHEALTMRGYSDNAIAMIFLSDGHPTVYLEGNDDIEKGNVTLSLGDAELSNKGITNLLPKGIKTIYEEDSTEAEIAADEAISSFEKIYPEMMVGTIAFNTFITDNLKKLATDSEFVIQIQNGSPRDLIDTMELITDYIPAEIEITDELSENVELYEKQPDFKIYVKGEVEKLLYSSETGLTDEGKRVLNNECPIEVKEKKVKVFFQKGYIVSDDYVYELSFNVNVSQKAFDKYADAEGTYTDKGDEDTDYIGNVTSSGEKGFYSNGEDTNVTYFLNGAKIRKNYRKPVIQTRDGTVIVKKTDLEGRIILKSALFELYRKAEKNEQFAVELEGYEGLYVKVNEGKTNENGEVQFQHLRLSPFDEGYPYYLVEKKAPEGYERVKKPVKIYIHDNVVKTENENTLVKTDGKTVVFKNAEKVEFSFTKVASHDYEKKLSGAEFELYMLTCGMTSHQHEKKCWELIEKQVSNPEVTFEKMISGNTFKLVEVKAPDGYVCPSGYWTIVVDSKKNMEIQNSTNPVKINKLDNQEYVIENAQEMKIPVTGGMGVNKIFFAGLMLIIGGVMMKYKNIKLKSLIIFAAFLLIFQINGISVSAIESDDGGIITVNGIEKDVSIQAYKLMNVTYDYEVQQPKNPMYRWVDEVSVWMTENYPEYIDLDNENAVKEDLSTAEEGKIAELYDKLAVAIKKGDIILESKNVIAKGEKAAIKDLTMGNYFILIEGGAKVYRPLSANVVPEWKNEQWEMAHPTVEAKSSEPTISKTVTDNLKTDHGDVGDKISFELNATVPTYPKNAFAKKYIISDKLSQGFTLVEDSIQVYGVNNNEATLLQNSYIKIDEKPVGDNNFSFALDFKYDVISNYQSLKISYEANLNENAVVGEEGNSNHALLEYNNNPYVSTSWKLDEDETIVYTYGVKITKIDEKDETKLSGAEFTLSKNGKEIAFTGEDGNYRVAADGEKGTTVLKTDNSGLLSLSGLDADNYELKEVKAPAGYVKLQKPINVTIADADMDGKPEAENVECTDGYVPVTVKNNKGFTLPVTGGIGTIVFNVVGIFLIGAGIFGMRKFSRKKKHS